MCITKWEEKEKINLCFEGGEVLRKMEKNQRNMRRKENSRESSMFVLVAKKVVNNGTEKYLHRS